MASYQAINAACETLARVLEASYDPAMLGGTSLQFSVYGTKDFEEPMSAGVSLFVYRLLPSSTFRSPPSKRLSPKGVRHRPQLGMDVHFLLTAWGQKASLELEILGLATRLVEDHGVLPASILNGVSPGTFDDEEVVEIVPGDLPFEDLMRIWDGLPRDYQMSVPYVARAVRIESLLGPPDWISTTERKLGAVPT